MLNMLTDGLKEVEVIQAGLISANDEMHNKGIFLQDEITRLQKEKSSALLEIQLLEKSIVELKEENISLRQKIGDLTSVSICC